MEFTFLIAQPWVLVPFIYYRKGKATPHLEIALRSPAIGLYSNQLILSL